MSFKKQIHSVCKLYSFHGEIVDEFLDEINVDSDSHHNTFHKSQSQHRIVRVIKESNKKSSAFKLIQFCDMKTQQRYILQEEAKNSRKGLSSLADDLRNFSRSSIKRASSYSFHYRNPNVELALQSQKTASLLSYLKILSNF